MNNGSNAAVLSETQHLAFRRHVERLQDELDIAVQDHLQDELVIRVLTTGANITQELATNDALRRRVLHLYDATYQRDKRVIATSWDEPSAFNEFLDEMTREGLGGAYPKETVLGLAYLRSTNTPLALLYGEIEPENRVFALWYLIRRNRFHQLPPSHREGAQDLVSTSEAGTQTDDDDGPIHVRGESSFDEEMASSYPEWKTLTEALVGAVVLDLIAGGKVDYLAFEVDLPEPPEETTNDEEPADAWGSDKVSEGALAKSYIARLLRFLGYHSRLVASLPVTEARGSGATPLPLGILEVEYACPYFDDATRQVDSTPAALGVAGLTPIAADHLQSALAGVTGGVPRAEVERILRGVYLLYFEYLADKAAEPDCAADLAEELREEHAQFERWFQENLPRIAGNAEYVSCVQIQDFVERLRTGDLHPWQ